MELLRHFLSLSVFALSAYGEVVYAGWQTDLSGADYYYTAVTNEQGQAFGQYCYLETKTCMYLLAIPTKCEQGAKYPALVNATSGAKSVELHCASEVAGSQVMAFEFDQIDNAVRQSEKIGIAIPLENDRFRVFRFDISGAAGPLDKMRTEALRAKPKSKKSQPTRKDGEYL